jgi:uncharacterized membrane protein
MGEYERSITINASRKQIEDFVSTVSNLPRYLPTTKKAESESGDRVRVQGEAPNGHTYDADGYFRVDEKEDRLEWGSDGENHYTGWMKFIGNATQAPSQVIVHLSFTPPHRVSEEMEKTSGSPDNAINDGLEKALNSIKNLLEGTGGKVE